MKQSKIFKSISAPRLRKHRSRAPTTAPSAPASPVIDSSPFASQAHTPSTPKKPRFPVPSGRRSVPDSAGGIQYRIYTLALRDYLREGTKFAVLAAVASYTFYRSFAVFLVLLPVAYLIFPRLMRGTLKERRLWTLTLQFKEAIWTVSGFLSAGMSVENAFAMAIPELSKLYGSDALIVREFQAIIRGVRLNKPIEPLLMDFAERSGLPDIRNFAEVFSIAKRNGGSLKDIIERTGRMIREKTAVSEEIKNMTASRRYEQNIMNILPFAIILYINLTSNGFLDVLYETLMGRVVMTACLLLTAASFLLSRKILDIPV